MGNSLSYNSQTNQLKTGQDTTILNNYINTFFKELPDDYAGTDKILKKRGLSLEEKEKLNELYKRPLKARACCLQQERIPIALPYVYPYKKDGFVGDDVKNYGMCNNNNDCKSNKCENKKCKPVEGDKKKDVIKTTFAKIKVFEEGSLVRNCGGEDGSVGFFRHNNKNIKMYPDIYEVASKKKFTADTDARRTMCKPFIGTVGFNSRKSSEIGICDRTIQTRRLSKPNNELYHFYGDAINGDQKVEYIDKGNSDNFRTLPANSNNAYPECSCTNSVYIRTPVTGDNGTKLSKMQTYAMQQNSDNRCRDADGNAFVSQIEKQPISMCVNIASNIKALADGGSKINMNQSCKAKTEVKKETNVDKMKGMNDEDDTRESTKDEENKKSQDEENSEKVKKAKERLREQESNKTEEQKAAEKKAEEDKIAAEKAKKEAEEKADLEAAQNAAALEAKKREEERLAKEAKKEAEARRQAEIVAAKKKVEMEATAKTRNMIMIGGGVTLIVVIMIIVLLSSGGDNNRYKKMDEDEDDDEDDE